MMVYSHAAPQVPDGCALRTSRARVVGRTHEGWLHTGGLGR